MVASAPSPVIEWTEPEAFGRAAVLTRTVAVPWDRAVRSPAVGTRRVAPWLLLVGDAVAALTASLLIAPVGSPSALLLVVGWVAALAVHRAYPAAHPTPGTTRARGAVGPVVRAGLALAFAVLVLAAVTGASVPPADLAGFTVATSAIAIGTRLVEVLARGSRTTRVVLVGHRHGVERVLPGLAAADSSLSVVHACLLGAGSDQGLSVPTSAGLANLRASVARHGADAVLVIPCRHLDAARIRRLGWDLEGAGTDLLVATALPDLDGPRVSLGRAGTLPLVHVRHCELRSARRMVKQLTERAVAAAALVVLAPVLLTLAALVRLESEGPALFRQTRVGRNGRHFTMVKLRTMCADAEGWRAELASDAADGSVLFKMRADPRVTRIGRFLRTYSLDELPQLINVVRGEMALVGPRPPLPDEVAQYDADTRRRLAVTPGLTGLWQVSGRSDLSWEESVRLDLRYVENWTLGLDLRILARTVGAVLGHRGAY